MAWLLRISACRGSMVIALLEKIKEINPSTEVVMITGYGTVESAVKAIKLGAYDYLTKPFDMDKLLKVVENVSTKFSLSEEIRFLRAAAQYLFRHPRHRECKR